MNRAACFRIVPLVGLLSTVSVPAATAVSELLDRIREYRPQQEVLRGPETVVLSGKIPAETVVFRQTTWELKNVPQSGALSSQMTTDALKLPEAERLKHMIRFDDHSQMWFVALSRYPQAGAELKPHLEPLPLTNRYHRETAFLGQGHGYAWFGHMPIYHWISLQKKLGLQNGDDPVSATARGLAIEDQGSMTANSVEWILVEAGPTAFPHLERAVHTTQPT